MVASATPQILALLWRHIVPVICAIIYGSSTSMYTSQVLTVHGGIECELSGMHHNLWELTKEELLCWVSPLTFFWRWLVYWSLCAIPHVDGTFHAKNFVLDLKGVGRGNCNLCTTIYSSEAKISIATVAIAEDLAQASAANLRLYLGLDLLSPNNSEPPLYAHSVREFFFVNLKLHPMQVERNNM